MIKLYGRSAGKVTNFKAGLLLSKEFSRLEIVARKLQEDRQANLNHAYYYCYIAPLLADLFQQYNSDKRNIAVLISCIELLQDKAGRNPAAELLLKDFTAIADKLGLRYEEVLLFN